VISGSDPVAFGLRLPPFTVLASLASGVGQYPDAVSSVRGTNGGSWYAVPFRIKPERGQVSENVAQPSTKQRCHVLHDDVSRSSHANDASHFTPKSAALPGKTGPASSKADVLAWEAAADDIAFVFIALVLLHIVIDRNLWPMLRQNLLAKGFALNERDCFHSSPFKSERKSSDPRKQVQDAQLGHLLSPFTWGPRGKAETTPRSVERTRTV